MSWGPLQLLRRSPRPDPKQSRTPTPNIHQVIDSREVRSAFQPLVDLSTGETFAYEALARCPIRHFANPLHLFEAAIDVGRCGELGRMLREMAVDGCTQHPLFINVNPNEFNEPWLVRPDDPIFWHEEALYVEITESVPLSHFELCSGVLREIRGKGIKLAVDDLGAGYSNLKYIADLEPEVVKIDRELIAGLDQNPRQAQLVRNIVELCHDMGAKVVAEGIETRDELHAVRDVGAHYGQGFLLAYPAFPPPEVDWHAINNGKGA